jgi:hypothetical protein
MGTTPANNYRRDDSVWFDARDNRNYNRAHVTCMNSGLSEDEKSVIPRVFNAISLEDMLKAANSYLYQYDRQSLRCSYNTKDFLEAVAVSCEADLARV